MEEAQVEDPNKEELKKKKRGRPPKGQLPETACVGCGQLATRSVSYQDGPTFDLCEKDDCEKAAMEKWQADVASRESLQEVPEDTFHDEVQHGELIPSMSELPAAPLGPYGSLTSLSLPDDLTYAEWASIGTNQLRTLEVSRMWWLGDYLAFGDRKYGQTWAQVADELGYAMQTVQNAKYVAEVIAPERRIPPPHDGKPGLFWSHHQEVAALGPKQQAKWLGLALENRWTRDELRDALREAKAGTSKETEPGNSKKGKKDKPPTAAEAVEGLMSFGRSIWEMNPDAALLNDWLGRMNLLIESEQWDWDTFDSLFTAMTGMRDKLLEKLREAVDVQKYRDVALSAAEEPEEE